MIFKATNATSLHTATIGRGSVASASIFGVVNDDRPTLEALVRRYGMWVHRCVGLNAQAAAAVPFRLFSTRSRAIVGKYRVRGSMTRPLSSGTKAYLSGRHMLKPGSVARKVLHGGMDDLTEITKHPALDLLNDVNPWTDGYAFREGLYSDLDLFGRAFIHTVEVAGGQPVELWRMLPQRMKVIPDPVKFVARFEFGDGADKVLYTTDEVLWFKLFDPADPWGGIGPLEAWLKTIDASQHIQNFQASLFEWGGTPDYLLIGEQAMDEPQKKAFRSGFRRLFGRLGNRKENIGIITGRPPPKLEKLTQTPRELEFSQSQKDVRDMIGQAFSVPKSMLTTDDVNLANSRVSQEIHMRSIWHKIQRVEDVLNERLLPRFGEGLVLVHENPVPEDKAIRVQERESLLQSGGSVNEVRELDDMEPLDTPMADEPLVAAGLSPLSAVGMSSFGFGSGASSSLPPLQLNGEDRKIESPPVLLQPAHIAAATAIIQLVADGQLPRDSGKAQLVIMFNLGDQQAEDMLGKAGAGFEPKPPAMPQLPAGQGADKPAEQTDDEPDLKLLPGHISHAAIWDSYLRGTLNGEIKCCKQVQDGLPFPAQMSARMRLFLGDQLRAVADELENRGVQDAAVLMRDDKWLRRMIDIIRPGMANAIERGGNSGMERIAIGAGFEVENPAVQEFIDSYTIRLATQIAGTTELMLSDVINQGLTQGRSNRDVANAIMTLDRGVSGFRAEMIARTESTRAYIAGQGEAWRSSGVVAGKKWLLAPNACEFCRALNREFQDRVIPLDDPFYTLGHILIGVEGGRLKLDYTPVLGPPLHPHDRCDLVPVLA